MDLLSSLITLVFLALTLAALATYVLRRRRRERRDAKALANAVAKRLHEPPSLHPVIDPDICIGSLSCISACPEGDILGIVDGSARLIRGANCIGHGKCALECPVGAIRLVVGTSERGVDLPEIDQSFESSRPGVHIVGELGGMGLIRNAILQGLQVADTLAARLKAPGDTGGAAVDVAIVGAGPAGLATALGCRAAGLTFRVLEQDTVGGTVAHYPRHKVVMSEELELPLHGRFGGRTLLKEELLAQFEQVRASGGIEVYAGTKVTGIGGQDGAFVVETSGGPVAARKVVLAVGRRGSPRKLGVPGEDLPKVVYSLVEPDQYEDTSVLVVGGGDSALEAAMQIADETNAKVTLSYRGEALGRCRDANRERFGGLVSAGRIEAIFSSTVTRITPDDVTISTAGGDRTQPNDAVIVCIGGELPVEFLNKAGVQIKRHHGTQLGEPIPLGTTKGARRRSVADEQDRRSRRLVYGLFFAGVAIIALLAWMGQDYYLLAGRERLKSPDHAFLKPAGTWGHGVGVVATLFMLLNFLYAVRKRWRILKGTAPIRNWLTFHMFVGFMSPLVIAFHAAFQSRNVLATSTGVSLAVVVVTGIVGRFIYGLVPTRGGLQVELAELEAQAKRGDTEAGSLVAAGRDKDALRPLVARANAAGEGSLARLLAWKMAADELALRFGTSRVRLQFDEAGTWETFRDGVLRLASVRRQVAFHQAFKRMLRGWRAFHAVLAGLLVLMIAAHIGFSIYLGYTWVFR